MIPQDKRVLVTGPQGLLGATLVRVLRSYGCEPVAFEGDIRNISASTQVRDSGANWVIHTAAKTDVGACEREPQLAQEVNVEGTKRVLEGARASGARFLYISTVSVFKGDKGDYTEDDVPEPTNVYNRTKYEAEQAVLAYEKGSVLRLNLIGIHPQGSRGRNFFEWLVDSVAANKDLNLFADSFVNPLSSGTVARHIAALVAREWEGNLLHIGSRDVLSKEAIGRLVLARFPDYKGTVRAASVDAIPDGVFRPKQMWLNTDRAAAMLGPMPSIAEEVEKIFQETLDPQAGL